CSENKEVTKDTKQVNESNKGGKAAETESKEDKGVEGKKGDASNTEAAPKIDENCAEVYSKEECEQFAAYTKSDAGEQEASASKEKSVQKEVKFSGKEVYEKMQWVLEQWGSGKIYPAPYKEGMVQKRTDGLYYINSTYEIRGTVKGDGIYPYEMLVSDTFDLKDAYLPGTYGRYARPMKYDEVQEYYRQVEEKKAIEKANETPEDRERKRKEAEEKEKKHKEVMESIYGKDAVNGKVIDMDKETLGE
ncbi:hypothetical protein, partial [Bacillus mycoides]|uniref:hypothetical protein n=1 Tax=Bacillus mycoides TaxID=1405 RepID=UPI003A810130